MRGTWATFAVRDCRFILFGLRGSDVSWRALWLFIVVFFGSLAAAAISLPLVYWGAAWIASAFNFQLALLGKTIRVDRLFELLRWIPILVGLPWIMWFCQLRSLDSLGLKLTPQTTLIVTRGFTIGLILVFFVGAGQIICGATALNSYEQFSAARFIGWILLTLASAILVGTIEEIVFRGLVLRLFYTATIYPWLALILSSLFFAYVHFKIPPGEWMKVSSVYWNTGWWAAYWMVTGIATDFELKKFLGLFLLGMVLGMLALRTGSLWPGIGLHGGLVFASILYHDLGHDIGNAGTFWGSKAIIDGWAGFIALVLLFIWAMRKQPIWSQPSKLRWNRFNKIQV